MSHVIATRIRHCLVVTVGQELSGPVLDELQRVALDSLSAHGLRALALDLTAVGIIDAHEFARLQSIAATARLLGADTLFIGLKPDVIAYLMNADADVSGAEGAPDLSAALERLSIRFPTDSHGRTEPLPIPGI